MNTKTKTKTLAEAANATFKARWIGTASARSREAQVRCIVKYFGSKTPITKITTKSVLDYVKYLEDKVGNDVETRNKKISAISVILDHSYTEGWIDSLPRLKGRKSANNQCKEYISKEEENIILPFMQNHDLESMRYFGDFWAWSVDTGLRPSESRRIKTQDIYKEPGIGFVVRINQTKTNDWRVIPLTQRAYEIFMMQNQEQPWAAMNESRIKHAWNRVREFRNRQGDRNYKPYLTRHTTGSRLLQNRVDITLVRDVLGHSNIQTTLRYAKNSPQHLAEAMKTLNV